MREVEDCVLLNSDVSSPSPPHYSLLDQSNVSDATRRATIWTDHRLWNGPVIFSARAYKLLWLKTGELRPVCDEDPMEWFDWTRLGLDNWRRGNWRVVTAHFKNPSKPTHGLQVNENNGSNSYRTVLTSPSSSFVVLYVLSEVNYGESFIWRTFLSYLPSQKICPVRLNVFIIVIFFI